MRVKWKQGFSAAVVSSMMFTGAAKAVIVNLLSNPDFESTSTGGVNASGGDVAIPVGNTVSPWQGYSTYFAPYSAYIISGISAPGGTQSGKTFGSPNCGIFQQVGVTAGDTYTATGLVDNLSTDALTGGVFQTIDIRLTFYDATGAPTAPTFVSTTHVNGNTPQNVWTPITVTAVAPLNTAYVDYRAFMINTVDGTVGGNAAYFGGAIYLDNASLTDVTGTPEPASLGAVALAGVGLLRRRRA